jgi:hypothetical protein
MARRRRIASIGIWLSLVPNASLSVSSGEFAGLKDVDGFGKLLGAP